jgi:diaminopimelate decarboxylase
MGQASLIEQRLQLFPDTATLRNQHLHIAGLDVAELARQYGTPLYLYDQASLDAALSSYRQAMAGYPEHSNLTYAGKAFLNLAMARWVSRQGLWLDCSGAGELHIASQAGVARGQILVHGVSKSADDLVAAFEIAGTVVIDNRSELDQILQLARQTQPPGLWLRIRPGSAVHTDHRYTQTGQEDAKFGMSFSEAGEAVQRCLDAGLPLHGIHFHQGSHFHDPKPIAPALASVLKWLAEMRTATGWFPQFLSPGGGWGVPYHEDDLPHAAIGEYAGFVIRELIEGCRSLELPLPALYFEPGRSLVARAGVAVYRVNHVKWSASRRWLLLDGGMADNPRPALYGARYTALPVIHPDRAITGPAWLGGPYCESGDVLIENLPMPDIASGEWIAIPVSGAYHLSMASNYNSARKPAVLWLENGQAHLVQRRETLKDLVARDQDFGPL